MDEPISLANFTLCQVGRVSFGVPFLALQHFPLAKEITKNWKVH